MFRLGTLVGVLVAFGLDEGGGRCLQAYRADVKTGVLMSRGLTTDPRLLSRTTALDAAIIRMARRVLPKATRIVFFLLYHCLPTPDDVRRVLREATNKDYKPETIEEYARNARHTIEESAPDSRELDEWILTFSKSQRTT